MEMKRENPRSMDFSGKTPLSVHQEAQATSPFARALIFYGPMSPVSEELRQAYLRTRYHVEGPAPFTLHIDQYSPPLENLMEKTGCSCAAFITAWNPLSRPLDLDQNLSLQRQLEQDIALGGWMSLPGFGQGADDDWLPEPSFLVLGIPLETARSLAGKYRQNAFVWCPGSAVPELVWIPSMV